MVDQVIMRPSFLVSKPTFRIFSAPISKQMLLVNPGQEGYHPFQETIRQTCDRLPGVCDPVLKKLCDGCQRDEISQDPTTLRFCGCFAPSLGQVGDETISPQCDPLCVRNEVIRLPDPQTGNYLECNADVCVIDNVAINATESQVQGVCV